MKRAICYLCIILSFFFLAGCGSGKCCDAIELMGAGDRIHDSYTFANTGVKISNDENNVYTIYGSVDKLANAAVKEEFKIAEDVTHVVVVKLTAIDTDVKKDEVEISTNGHRAYDAEHLNGSDYTFIILEAIPSTSVTITAKWNKDAEEKSYIVKFADDIELKS